MRQRNIAQNMYNVRRKSFRSSFGPTTVALCLSFCVVVCLFKRETLPLLALSEVSLHYLQYCTHYPKITQNCPKSLPIEKAK